ncbi:MAG: hypothetical protein AB8B97_19415 [Granulosicoccus sp.]
MIFHITMNRTNASSKVLAFMAWGALCSPAFSSDFWLIDADSDERVIQILDGMQIQSSRIPEYYSISYEPEEPIHSNGVTIRLNGPLSAYRYERSSPFTLYGDNRGGDGTTDYYSSWADKPLIAGNYTISANNSLVTFSVNDRAIKFLEPIDNTFTMDDDEKTKLYSQITPQGIWSWATYKPEDASKEIYPGLRGVPILIGWRALYESLGSPYNWDRVGSLVTSARADGLYYSLEFSTGHELPVWFFDNNIVPPVVTNSSDWVFPYYLDDDYKAYFWQFNQEIAYYLSTLSDAERNAVVAVVINNGSTGDPAPYKGKPTEEQFDISSDQWEDFRIEHYQVMKDVFSAPGLENMPLAFTQTKKRTEDFILNNISRSITRKNGMASHGYHIPEPESIINAERKAVFEGVEQLGGARMIYFGEMDREWKNGWFQKAPAESFYWSAIYALHRGLSRWQVRTDALEQDQYDFAFDFFNKHAPHTNAATSPYAFVALRQGLDASDTQKFPEEDFGKTGGRPVARLENILENYSAYGARIDIDENEDPERPRSGPFGFRQREGYIDVMYGGVSGNYNKFLYQINPEAESVGWWHVGEKTWPYGRFARSFDRDNGKNAMYFQLDSNFIEDSESTHGIRVEVTYFDDGVGEWELLYNGPEGLTQAYAIATTDSQEWKKVQVDLTDSKINGGLSYGADLILQHIGGDDTKFHMIELERL